jgi:cell division septation protein DedD
LSGGAIAGIVIGSVVAAAILAALAALLCIRTRRRKQSQTDAALNQPNPQRKGGSPSMHQTDSPTNINMVPGGRVTRMSALREMPSSSPANSRTSRSMFGGGGTKGPYSDTSDSDAMGASPGAMSRSRSIPPVTGKRHGSLSSSSALAGLESDSSPRSGTVNTYSSPEAVTSGQSEQLSYFRDYYSQDEIHPGDKVAGPLESESTSGQRTTIFIGSSATVVSLAVRNGPVHRQHPPAKSRHSRLSASVFHNIGERSLKVEYQRMRMSFESRKTFYLFFSP